MKISSHFLNLLLIATLIITLSSCKKEKADLISTNILEKTFYYEDEYQIEATSKSTISYTVENEYHATITQTGYLTAGRIGETTVSINNAEDQKKFKVIVKPRYTLYPEPDVKFGDPKDSIISQFGTDYIKSARNIGYTNYYNTAPIILFIFDENDLLESYMILVESSYTSILEKYLEERYVLVKNEDDALIFFNGLSEATTTTTIIMRTYDASYRATMYQIYSSLVKSPDLKYSSSFKEYDNILSKLISSKK